MTGMCRDMFQSVTAQSLQPFSLQCRSDGFDPLVSTYLSGLTLTPKVISRKQRGLYQGMANMWAIHPVLRNPVS